MMKKGEYVFRFGDTGDKFYVILKGEVSVRIPDPKMKNNPNPNPPLQPKMSTVSNKPIQI